MRNRFVLLALLLPVVGACSSDSASNTSTGPAASTVATTTAAITTAATAVTTTVAEAAPADATTTVPAAPAPAPAGDGTVGIADFKFDPPTVNVPVGGSVEWTNNDTQQHTATSAGNFDAGAIQPGTSMSVTFDTAGSFTYICSFHPFMTGMVVVG